MKRFFTILVSGAALAAAVPAFSQASEVLQNGRYGLRLGAFLPFDEDLRDMANIWFGAGLDFEIEQGLFENATTVLSLDWFTQNGGTSGNIFPMIISQRWNTFSEKRRTYFQGGIGATILNFGTATGGTEVVFGARAGVGIEFNDRYYGEANFFWSDSKNGLPQGTGIGIYGGMHF